MEPIQIFVAIVVGFFAGNVLFSIIVKWIGFVGELYQTSPQGWRMALAASLFHSGPWTIFVTGMFAWYLRSDSWAQWFFGGIIAALLFMGGFVGVILIKQRQAKTQRPKNAV